MARDSLGWVLGYYDADYTAISHPTTANNFEPVHTGTAFSAHTGQLYNGNIRHTAVAIGGMDVLGTAYRYDQLHRLKKADTFTGLNVAGNTWSGASDVFSWSTSYAYDANGNITGLTRQGNGTAMDDLTYHYYTGNNNRLEYVDDPVSSGNYDFDIDDQSSGNYTYWENGALKSDLHDEIALIEWTVDRKVKTITRTTGSTLPDLEFWCDAMGRRLMKIEKPRPGGSPSAANLWIYTGYQHDAGGNVMAIYGFEVSGFTQTGTLKEHNVYGAGRLGVVNRDKLIATYSPITEALTLEEHDDTSRTLGHKIFEFSGHTGNVHLTTTDRTIPVDDGDGEIYTFLPDVNSTADFYPFGMQKPGRFNNSDSYRYAFQGMETDGEKTGNHGGSYTTEFRQYDPRLGRWLSVDPLQIFFPEWSPYKAFLCNPIFWTDPSGGSEDGYVFDSDTGEKTWVSKEGGKDYDVIYINGEIGEDGSVTIADEVQIIDKSTTGGIGFSDYKYSGPVGLNYKGEWTHATSYYDLWSDVPSEYLGEYMLGDLQFRHRALQSHLSGQSSHVYEAIRDQERQGLRRTEMIWNLTDYLQKYGNASGLMIWAQVMTIYMENLMLMPGGGLAKPSASVKKYSPERVGTGIKPKPITKSNVKRGKAMHDAYKVHLKDQPGMCKECRKVKGVRPDFVDFNTNTIYELKPNNPNAIARGRRQLLKYKDAYEKETGETFNIKLETY